MSREHALLLSQPNGSWTVNGYRFYQRHFVNDHSQRISPHHEVPLAEGDRVHSGVDHTHPPARRKEEWRDATDSLDVVKVMQAPHRSGVSQALRR